MSPESPLTLEGLADALRQSGEATDRRLRAMQEQDEALGRRIDSLTGQVEALVALMREQGLRITLLAEQHAEHEQHIRRILHRLEQHDGRLAQHEARLAQNEARLAEQNDKILQILHRLEQNDARLAEQQAEIRRILDRLERRGGDGGPPREVTE